MTVIPVLHTPPSVKSFPDVVLALLGMSIALVSMTECFQDLSLN